MTAAAHPSQAHAAFHTESSPRLAYRIHGISGEPVVLVMGLAMAGRAWGPQIETLSKHHRVLSYDHRGVGASERLRRPLSIRLMAQDGLRVVEAAGFSKAHLVGVSMGGMVAQEMALADPNRWHSATFIATHAGGPGTWLPPIRSVPDFLRSRAGSRRHEYVRRLLYTDNYVAKLGKEAVDGRLAGLFAELKPLTLPAQIFAVFGHRTRRRLSSLDVPTLLVRAAEDRMISARATAVLERALPNAERWVLEGVGHGLLLERPDQINTRLLDFFGRAEAG